MKRIFRILIVLAAALIGSGVLAPSRAQDEAPLPGAGKRVYVIPIKGMIEKGLIYVIRRGVMEADAGRADAIIFDMDTPGGAVNATKEIIHILQSLKVPSYTYVEDEAISAGSMIALSTDHIYMTPGSRIGDAMPIMASPTGGVQPLPEAEREKITSYVDSMVRASAERKGHDKELASCMVRRELAYKIGDDVISPEGQLLTLTAEEAVRPVGEDGHNLLASGIVNSMDDLLREAGLNGATLVVMKVTGAERVARFIAALAPLFLMAGLVGLYLEFKAPGFGLPGILGLSSLAIYFWGHHIAGLAGMEDVFFVLVGLVLIGVEIFVIPGFGFVGVAGLLCLFWGLLSAMIPHLPSDPLIPTWPQLEIPFRNMAIALVCGMGGAILLGAYLPRSRSLRPLVLDAETSSTQGFRAARPRDDLLHAEGTAISDLRPGGTVRVGDRQLDVVTRGEFLREGTQVRVVETHGSRILVEAVETAAS